MKVQTYKYLSHKMKDERERLLKHLNLALDRGRTAAIERCRKQVALLDAAVADLTDAHLQAHGMVPAVAAPARPESSRDRWTQAVRAACAVDPLLVFGVGEVRVVDMAWREGALHAGVAVLGRAETIWVRAGIRRTQGHPPRWQRAKATVQQAVLAHFAPAPVLAEDAAR